MNILGSIILLLGGILAASAYIVSKKPEAERLIAKIMPFNGLIGIAMLAWGMWSTFDVIFHLGRYTELIKLDPFWGFVSMLFIPFIALTVGFMLSFAMIARWIPGQGSSEEKLLELRKKLIRITTPLGLLAILAGVLQLFRLFF